MSRSKDARRVTPGGYLGDPASFDAAEEGKMWEDDSKKIAEAIEKHLKLKLTDGHFENDE